MAGRDAVMTCHNPVRFRTVISWVNLLRGLALQKNVGWKYGASPKEIMGWLWANPELPSRIRCVMRRGDIACGCHVLKNPRAGLMSLRTARHWCA